MRLVLWQTDDGFKPALVDDHGRKWLRIIIMHAGEGRVRVLQEERQEERYMRQLERKGKPYPMSRALPCFHRFARARGMTKGARQLLAQAGRGD